jgi:hypothetical protein
MITLVTSALLSCGEAKDLVYRISRSDIPRSEYRDLVHVVKHSAPRGCRVQARVRRRDHRRGHHPTRVVVRPIFVF